MMSKDFGIICFILLTAVWIHLLLEGKINGITMAILLVCTSFAICLLYNGGNIHNLIFDYKAGRVLAEMNKINDELFAKTETVKKIGEEMADIAAFTVTSVSRYAPHNLQEIMLEKRDRLQVLLRDIGSSEERITKDSLIIENMVANDLPPKKWTQRRDGFSMIASSKNGGVQWQGKTEKRSDLTGNLKFLRSR